MTYRHYLTLFILLLCCIGSIRLIEAEEVKALRIITVRDRQEAQQIRQQLSKGASFSALAAQKSLGPERQVWGYSGTVRLSDVQSELRGVLQSLQPGQISDVIAVGQQFVIIKVISPQIERYYETADRALAQNKIEVALEALQAALKLERDNIETYLRLATVYSLARRYKDALPYLDQAYRYAPQSIQVLMLHSATYTKAAVAHNDRAYADTALQDYETVLQMSPSLAPSVNFGMGKIYLAVLQQPQKAISHLEKAVRPLPDIPEVYELLIRAYYETKRYTEARDYLRLAQRLGFEFPKLQDALRNVKQQQ